VGSRQPSLGFCLFRLRWRMPKDNNPTMPISVDE
jgi:hypothetical protein